MCVCVCVCVRVCVCVCVCVFVGFLGVFFSVKFTIVLIFERTKDVLFHDALNTIYLQLYGKGPLR